MKRKQDGFDRHTVRIREHILHISKEANVGHIGSGFSIVEILWALYFSVLRINKKRPLDPNRDRFILSKGHAANALFAVLYEKGLMEKSVFLSYCKDGGLLEEHPSHRIPFIEASTGSLGHGLSIACGMALAGKLDRKTYRTFVLMSDAECDEGETWEAALFAGHHRLNRLIGLIDYNGVQAFGDTREVLDLEPLEEKWKSFGWDTRVIDGHDMHQIESACQNNRGTKPTMIICRTVRGKGVGFMEHRIEWHYKNPNPSEYKKAMKELKQL